MRTHQVNNVLFFLGAVVLLGIFFVSAQEYKGGVLIYTVFSISFLSLLISAFYNNTSYAYLFLAIFLWMGFWAKLSAHLIIGYGYVEPTGGFNWSADAWDQVLWISTVACWGVVAGRLLFLLKNKGEGATLGRTLMFYPEWYPYHRKVLWIFLIVFVLGFAVANATLGIQQIGLYPRTVLPWPMNALIAWMVSIGSAIAVASIAWWELSYNRQAWFLVFAVLIEAFVSATSILSRGVYLFHSVPQLIALYNNKAFTRFSALKLSIVAIMFGVLFVVSMVSVTTFRALLYPHVGGFTTLDQERLTRVEVLNGGINHIRNLMLKGEPREEELLSLLKEKDQLEMALKLPFSKDHETLNKLSALDELILKERALKVQDANYQSDVLPQLLRDRSTLVKKLSKVRITDEHRKRIRIEILNGGINHIKKQILKGEPREEELLSLLKEKDQLEMALKLPFSKDHETLNKLSALDELILKERALKVQDANYQSDVLPQLLRDREYLIRQFLEVGWGIKRIERESQMFAFIPKALADGLKEEEKVPSLVRVGYESDKSDLIKEVIYQLRTGWFKQVLSLSVDRWIGLEGVMAVALYDKKGTSFMFDALLEKRYRDSVTKYQEVCQSKYLYTDNHTWQFASLPGSVAFLYFSGSAMIVFFGMFLFSILIQSAERMVFYLTKNPILCALLGGVLANWVAQFGITPRQDIPYYALIGVSVLFIYTIQKIKVPNQN